MHHSGCCPIHCCYFEISRALEDDEEMVEMIQSCNRDEFHFTLPPIITLQWKMAVCLKVTVLLETSHFSLHEYEMKGSCLHVSQFHESQFIFIQLAPGEISDPNGTAQHHFGTE